MVEGLGRRARCCCRSPSQPCEPSLRARPCTLRRAPDCLLRQDGHGSHPPSPRSRGGCGCGDEHPRRACAVAHVDPGDDVGRASEPAPTTAELVPSEPVGSFGVPTARTMLRGIGSVHFDERHPGLPCFVSEVLSELVERPRSGTTSRHAGSGRSRPFGRRPAWRADWRSRQSGSPSTARPRSRSTPYARRTAPSFPWRRQPVRCRWQPGCTRAGSPQAPTPARASAATSPARPAS